MFPCVQFPYLSTVKWMSFVEQNSLNYLFLVWVSLGSIKLLKASKNVHHLATCNWDNWSKPVLASMRCLFTPGTLRKKEGYEKWGIMFQLQENQLWQIQLSKMEKKKDIFKLVVWKHSVFGYFFKRVTLRATLHYWIYRYTLGAEPRDPRKWECYLQKCCLYPRHAALLALLQRQKQMGSQGSKLRRRERPGKEGERVFWVSFVLNIIWKWFYHLKILLPGKL